MYIKNNIKQINYANKVNNKVNITQLPLYITFNHVDI